MPDKTDPPRRTASLLALAGRRMMRVLAGRLRPLGLAPAQFIVLQELWYAGALTQRELVDRCAVEQATMAATLKRMERDGLITREPCAHDHRAQFIRPTARACALERPAVEIAVAIDRETQDALAPDERAALRGALVRMLERLERR